MSVSYEEFFSWVLPEVAGCPEITAIQAIRDTVIDFCEKSLIHVVDHDPVKVIAKQSDYELDTPILGHRIIKVMQAYYQGQMLEPVSPDDVTDPSVYNQKIGGYTASYATPRGFMQKSWDTISLIPIPDQTVSSAVNACGARTSSHEHNVRELPPRAVRRNHRLRRSRQAPAFRWQALLQR